MSQDTPRNPITLKPLVYSTADADAVKPRRDVTFAGSDGGELLMDLYYPPTTTEGRRLPVVLIVEGFNDVGAERILGCRFKDMVSIEGWGRLIAANGMVAIVGTNRNPLADAHALLRHVRDNAAALGLDESRIGVWASSGHGPVALSILISDRRLTCAAFLYPYSMDLDGSTAVAEAQKMWRFDNGCEGRSIDELPADLPIFIVRAGRDQMPRLNEALDRFVAGALARNLPLSLVNYAQGEHAFDLTNDSEGSRETIRNTLAFLRQCLA